MWWLSRSQRRHNEVLHHLAAIGHEVGELLSDSTVAVQTLDDIQTTVHIQEKRMAKLEEKLEELEVQAQANHDLEEEAVGTLHKLVAEAEEANSHGDVVRVAGVLGKLRQSFDDLKAALPPPASPPPTEPPPTTGDPANPEAGG
jgi:uncharacterized protein YigA (DUF484 family)